MKHDHDTTPPKPPSGYVTSRVNARPFADRLEEWLDDTPFITANHLRRPTYTFFTSKLKTEQTRLAYFKALKRFFAEALTPELDTTAAITTDIIQNHIDLIAAKRPKQAHKDPYLATRARALSALRAYFRYLKTKGVINENPATDASLVFPSGEKGSTKALEPHEVVAVINGIDASTPEGRRDRALIAFLAFTLCRISAALNLTHKHLQPDGSVRLYEKGSRALELTIPPNLPAYLDPYLADIIHPEPSEPVFRTYDKARRRFTNQPLPYLQAYLIVRHHVSAAGITRRITPHSFRATGITELLEAGLPLETVSQWANHKRLDTTLRYDRKSRVKPSHMQTIAQIYSASPAPRKKPT